MYNTYLKFVFAVCNKLYLHLHTASVLVPDRMLSNNAADTACGTSSWVTHNSEHDQGVLQLDAQVGPV